MPLTPALSPSDGEREGFFWAWCSRGGARGTRLPRASVGLPLQGGSLRRLGSAGGWLVPGLLGRAGE
jgi:hypothetical protein